MACLSENAYFSGAIFDRQVFGGHRLEDVVINHLRKFGLSSATLVNARNPIHARKIVLHLHRQLALTGDSFDDLHRLACWLVKPERFHSHKMPKEDLAAVNRDGLFRERLHFYRAIIRDIESVEHGFRCFGCDHARRVIVRMGIEWGKLVLLSVIRKQARRGPHDAMKLARWCVGRPHKVKLDRIRDSIPNFVGWITGNRWKQFLQQWAFEHHVTLEPDDTEDD